MGHDEDNLTMAEDDTTTENLSVQELLEAWLHWEGLIVRRPCAWESTPDGFSVTFGPYSFESPSVDSEDLKPLGNALGGLSEWDQLAVANLLLAKKELVRWTGFPARDGGKSSIQATVSITLPFEEHDNGDVSFELDPARASEARPYLLAAIGPTKICEKCKKPVFQGAAYCSKCGSQLPSST